MISPISALAPWIAGIILAILGGIGIWWIIRSGATEKQRRKTAENHIETLEKNLAVRDDSIPGPRGMRARLQWMLRREENKLRDTKAK